MKWVPLLIIGGGTGICFHLLQGVSCLYSDTCQTARINYNVSGGDWVAGQPSLLLETFASTLLAEIYTGLNCANSQNWAATSKI